MYELTDGIYHKDLVHTCVHFLFSSSDQVFILLAVRYDQYSQQVFLQSYTSQHYNLKMRSSSQGASPSQNLSSARYYYASLSTKLKILWGITGSHYDRICGCNFGTKIDLYIYCPVSLGCQGLKKKARWIWAFFLLDSSF